MKDKSIKKEAKRMALGEGMMFWLVIIAVVGRCAPHIANYSPFMACAWLLVRSGASRLQAFSLPVLMFLLSDMVLAMFNPHPSFGMWTVWTYTGLMQLLALALVYSSQSLVRQGAMLGVASFWYWCWTNAGVWLSTGMYAHNAAGLFQCYTNALPFLIRQVAGDVVWFGLLISMIVLLQSARAWLPAWWQRMQKLTITDV